MALYTSNSRIQALLARSNTDLRAGQSAEKGRQGGLAGYVPGQALPSAHRATLAGTLCSSCTTRPRARQGTAGKPWNNRTQRRFGVSNPARRNFVRIDNHTKVTHHHLFECLLAPMNFLCRIGIVRIGGGVIKLGDHVDLGPIEQVHGLGEIVRQGILKTPLIASVFITPRPCAARRGSKCPTDSAARRW